MSDCDRSHHQNTLKIAWENFKGMLRLILVIILFIIAIILIKIIPLLVILSNDNHHSHITYIHPKIVYCFGYIIIPHGVHRALFWIKIRSLPEQLLEIFGKGISEVFENPRRCYNTKYYLARTTQLWHVSIRRYKWRSVEYRWNWCAGCLHP